MSEETQKNIEEQKTPSPKEKIIKKTKKDLGTADKILTKTPSPEGEKATIVKKTKKDLGTTENEITNAVSVNTGESVNNFNKIVEKIDNTENTKNIKKLKNSKIIDIRFKTDILAKNLSTETTKRLKAYTSGYNTSTEFYTLDYVKMGTDKDGLSHEMFVGLGEILLDPKITKIEVIKDGQTIIATRDIVAQGKNKGRIGFIDGNGDYVATHTGDKFKILEVKKMTNKDYENTKIAENKARKKHKEEYVPKLEKEITLYKNEKPAKYKEDGKIETKDGTIIDEKFIHEVETECVTSLNNEDLPNSRKKIIKLTKYVAKEIGIPAATILGIFKRESNFTWQIVGDGGKAIGISQFHIPAWNHYKSHSKYTEIMGKITKNPEEIGRAKCILADILVTAIALKTAIGKYGFDPNNLTKENLKKIRFFFHVPGYATNLMKNPNDPTALAFYNKKENKYSNYATYVQNLSA